MPQIPYVNISSFCLTREEDKCLKLGPKYVDKKINLKDLIQKIEKALKYISDEDASRIKNLAEN